MELRSKERVKETLEANKISVIIPVYKVEEYLPRCLDSIISQTYKNLEIILVDDGSPDKCGKICDEYAERDERIRVIHKENGGVAKARNTGLDAATGDYVGFVDSDDWIENDMYELLMKNALSYDADISMCGERIYEEEKCVTSRKNKKTEVLDRTGTKKRVVVGGSMGLIWNKLIRRSVLKNIRFDIKYDCSEDLLFMYEVIKNIDKTVMTNTPKYNYCRRLGGLTMREPSDSGFFIVDIMRYMLESEKNSAEVYPLCIKGFTDAAYTVLSGVITSGFGADRYDELRNELLSYRKAILLGGYHSTKDKVKIIILSVSKRAYNAMIRKVRGC